MESNITDLYADVLNVEVWHRNSWNQKFGDEASTITPWPDRTHLSWKNNVSWQKSYSSLANISTLLFMRNRIQPEKLSETSLFSGGIDFFLSKSACIFSNKTKRLRHVYLMECLVQYWFIGIRRAAGGGAFPACKLSCLFDQSALDYHKASRADRGRIRLTSVISRWYINTGWFRCLSSAFPLNRLYLP